MFVVFILTAPYMRNESFKAEFDAVKDCSLYRYLICFGVSINAEKGFILHNHFSNLPTALSFLLLRI